MKRLSSLKENNNSDASKTTVKSADVTEFDLLGMKVIVKFKSNNELKGRISFFSKSNCRDWWPGGVELSEEQRRI